jgi:hypothetical protein
MTSNHLAGCCRQDSQHEMKLLHFQLLQLKYRRARKKCTRISIVCSGNSGVGPEIRGYYADDGDLPPKVGRHAQTSGVTPRNRARGAKCRACPPDSSPSQINVWVRWSLIEVIT